MPTQNANTACRFIVRMFGALDSNSGIVMEFYESEPTPCRRPADADSSLPLITARVHVHGHVHLHICMRLHACADGSWADDIEKNPLQTGSAIFPANFERLLWQILDLLKGISHMVRAGLVRTIRNSPCISSQGNHPSRHSCGKPKP